MESDFNIDDLREIDTGVAQSRVDEARCDGVDADAVVAPASREDSTSVR